MSEVKVLRKWFTEISTISEVFVDGKRLCYGIEDRIRAPGVKVKERTAIPPGKYKLVWDFSPKFQRQVLHVMNVPMFVGIRIHAGNDAEDTEGCLCVGQTRSRNKLSHSKLALEDLEETLTTMGDEHTIEYVNVDPPAELIK